MILLPQSLPQVPKVGWRPLAGKMDSPTHAGPGLADVPLLFADHQLVDVVLVELVEDEKDVVHRPPRSTFLLFLRACSHKGFLVIVAERIPGGGASSHSRSLRSRTSWLTQRLTADMRSL